MGNCKAVLGEMLSTFLNQDVRACISARVTDP